MTSNDTEIESAQYLVGEGWFENGRLAGVTVQNTASPEPPYYHLWQPYRIDLDELLDMVKSGYTVDALIDTGQGERRYPMVIGRDQSGHDVAMLWSQDGKPRLADLKPGESPSES